MGPDGIEIEVERSEEEIRADKAQNVKGYFESKKSGTDFTPIEVKTTKRVSSLRLDLGSSFYSAESFIKERDAYRDEMNGILDHIDRFMDLFMK